MKNQFIVTLLIFCMSATVAMAQTKKPTTTTKKPTTTVKTTPPKTTTVKTTTTPTSVTPPVIEEKKTTTTTTTTTPTNQTTTSSTTTTTQSSGPSKGKKISEPKPEKVKEPKPERVRETKPERVKKPRDAYSNSGGVKFGIRAEASQLISFETGGTYDISPGVNAGLFANIPLGEKVSVQPEVLFSMQVAKVDPVKNTTNSILVPLTLNFNLGNGNTKFVISPGGYANYYLSASNTTNGVTVAADLTGVDKFYYGAVLGLGVKINSKLLIEVRSFYDLKESNNKEILSTFGIGYMF
jgi:Outer membrane protein beta-barrel domain